MFFFGEESLGLVVFGIVIERIVGGGMEPRLRIVVGLDKLEYRQMALIPRLISRR